MSDTENTPHENTEEPRANTAAPNAPAIPPAPGVTTLRPGRGRVEITLDGLLDVATALSGVVAAATPGSAIASAIVNGIPVVRAAGEALENVVLPELRRLFARGNVTGADEARAKAAYDAFRVRWDEIRANPPDHWNRTPA